MQETKPRITAEMSAALHAPMPPESLQKHPSKSFLTTIKAIYITERLNDVFGLGRWYIDHEVVERTPDYVLVKGRFVSLDYDVRIPDQYGGHSTSGKGTEIADGCKSAVTDCQSKLASYLGVGIDVFKGKGATVARKSTGYAAKASSSAEKQWYNDFEKQKHAMQVKVDAGSDPAGIVSALREKYKVSKEVEGLILAIQPSS